jgi:hypothetical protein
MNILKTSMTSHGIYFKIPSCSPTCPLALLVIWLVTNFSGVGDLHFGGCIGMWDKGFNFCFSLISPPLCGKRS